MKPFTSCLAYFSMLTFISIIDALTDEILHGVCTIKASLLSISLSVSLEAESDN